MTVYNNSYVGYPPLPKIINAHYMNKWLGEGNEVSEINIKTLGDLKRLISYYKDVIVPGKPVSISYSNKENANAKEAKVSIPSTYLKKGEVDATIGLMVHELHHIKLSPSVPEIVKVIWNFVYEILTQLEFDGELVVDTVFDFANSDIVSLVSEGNTPTTPGEYIIKTIIGDIFTLVNAAEDLRIDNNTSPYLRKYLDVLSDLSKGYFIKLFNEGALTTNTPKEIGYLLLGHHLGHFHSDFIEEKLGDLDTIVSCPKHEISNLVLDAFKNEIAEFVVAVCAKWLDELKINKQDSSDDVDFTAIGEAVSSENLSPSESSSHEESSPEEIINKIKFGSHEVKNSTDSDDSSESDKEGDETTQKSASASDFEKEFVKLLSKNFKRNVDELLDTNILREKAQQSPEGEISQIETASEIITELNKICDDAVKIAKASVLSKDGIETRISKVFTEQEESLEELEEVIHPTKFFSSDIDNQLELLERVLVVDVKEEMDSLVCEFPVIVFDAVAG